MSKESDMTEYLDIGWDQALDDGRVSIEEWVEREEAKQAEEAEKDERSKH